MFGSKCVSSLEDRLLRMCVIYQSIIVDIDAVFTEMDLLLSNGDSEAALLSIGEVKSKYLPKLREIRNITELILNSSEQKISTITH